MAELFRVIGKDGSVREIVADDEREASETVEPGEVIVRIMTDKRRTEMRLDNAMARRTARDAAEREARAEESKQKFIEALMGGSST